MGVDVMERDELIIWIIIGMPGIAFIVGVVLMILLGLGWRP
jgi:hypothetical protein